MVLKYHAIYLFVLVSSFIHGGYAERIVRFLSNDGKVYFGDAILPANTTNAAFSTSARVIEGDVLGEYRVTRQVKVNDLIFMFHGLVDTGIDD